QANAQFRRRRKSLGRCCPCASAPQSPFQPSGTGWNLTSVSRTPLPQDTARMSVAAPTMFAMPGGVSFDDIAWLRANSPAWRLLRADSSPLVLSFLHRVFVADNVRAI